MKRLAAVFVCVVFVLAGLPGCGWQNMSTQEKIKTVSRILKVFRPSRPHTYDPTFEAWLRRDYASLHSKVEDDLKQHIALTKDVLREHAPPID